MDRSTNAWSLSPHDTFYLSSKVVRRLDLDDIVALVILAFLSFAYLSYGYLYAKPEPDNHLFFVTPQDTSGIKRKSQDRRNIVEKLSELDKDVVIFFGSQSGRGQGFANSLAREFRVRLGVNALVADLDDYDHRHLSTFPANKIMILILATYGEGGPPDNANTFQEYLSGSHHEKTSTLTSLRYFAYGLGDSNYRLYNRFVDEVDERMQAAGALRLGYIGKGDAALGNTVTEDSFGKWKADMLKALGEIMGKEARPMTYEPSLEVFEQCAAEPAEIYLGEPSSQHLTGSPKSNINLQNPYAAPVALSKELFTRGDRNCVHMEFDISKVPSLKYVSGDHLAVWPINPEREVERLIGVLGWDETMRNACIDIAAKENGTPVPLPTPTTRETVLRYYLEICGPVSYDLVGLLKEFAPSENGKDMLEALLRDWTRVGEELSSKYLNVAKLMQLAEPSKPWTNVPLALLIESLPKLRPRYYSIASSPSVAARKPAITAVVNAMPSTPTGPNPTAERFHGVATNYLLALNRHLHGDLDSLTPKNHPNYALSGPRNKLEGPKVLLHIRPSTFKLPTNPARPIIMVAAGTGIAPFRGFVQERGKLASMGKDVGPALLFFGCRHPDEDFLYRDEWEAFQRQQPGILDLVTAFSRREEAEGKVYVQQRVRERGEEVARLILEEQAYFYICGSVRMAADVRVALLEMLAQWGGKSGEEADRYLKMLKKIKRYQEDVWSS